MYRFFVEEDQIGEREIVITGSDVNHIRNVLRMKPGEQMRRKGQKESCLPGSICFRACQRAIRWNSSSRRRWSWACIR